MDGPIGYCNGGDELIYEWQEIGKGWHRCLGLVTYLHMTDMFICTNALETTNLFLYRHRNQTSMINQIFQTFETELAAIFFFKNLSYSSFCTYTWTYIMPNLHIKEMKFAIAIFETFRLHLHDFRLWNQVCSRRSTG